MLTPVVLPVGEGLGRRGFAARIAPRQSETDEEQQPDERSSEWQKTIETISGHTISSPSDQRDPIDERQREVNAARPTRPKPLIATVVLISASFRRS